LSVIAASLKEYVLECGTTDGMGESEVSDEIDRILSDVFTRKVTDLDRCGIRKILASYCSRKGVCADFTCEFENL